MISAGPVAAPVAEAALGLYLHIPFCDAICNYCNFNRGLLDTELKARYLVALEGEIARASEATPVDTIFLSLIHI